MAKSLVSDIAARIPLARRSPGGIDFAAHLRIEPRRPALNFTLLSVCICFGASLSGACRTNDRQAYASDEVPANEPMTAVSKPLNSSPQDLPRATQQASAPVKPFSLSAGDREFAEQAAQGGMLEVESSKLAVERSRSEALRNFATMMVADHGSTHRELETLAKSKAVTLPSSLDSKHQARLDELRDLSGAEFDSKYHALQLTAHDEAIELFEKASREGSDGELRAFANETLPVLRKHRAELDTIQIPR